MQAKRKKSEFMQSISQKCDARLKVKFGDVQPENPNCPGNPFALMWGSGITGRVCDVCSTRASNGAEELTAGSVRNHKACVPKKNFSKT